MSGIREVEGLSVRGSREHVHLKVPPARGLRSCVGLVLAGMATRARVGVGGLEEAVELLEGAASDETATNFRFSLRGEGVVAEVEEPAGIGEGGEAGEGSRWRTVVEMVS